MCSTILPSRFCQVTIRPAGRIGQTMEHAKLRSAQPRCKSRRDTLYITLKPWRTRPRPLTLNVESELGEGWENKSWRLVSWKCEMRHDISTLINCPDDSLPARAQSVIISAPTPSLLPLLSRAKHQEPVGKGYSSDCLLLTDCKQ